MILIEHSRNNEFHQVPFWYFFHYKNVSLNRDIFSVFSVNVR